MLWKLPRNKDASRKALMETFYVRRKWFLGRSNTAGLSGAEQKAARWGSELPRAGSRASGLNIAFHHPRAPKKQFSPFFEQSCWNSAFCIFFLILLSNSVDFGFVGVFFCVCFCFAFVFFNKNQCQQHAQAPSMWGWNSCLAVLTPREARARAVPDGANWELHSPHPSLGCRWMRVVGEGQKNLILYRLSSVRISQPMHTGTNSRWMAPKNIWLRRAL